MQAYEEEYRISWFVLIPVKMFWVLGEDHNPSFEYTPWCFIKKCIIHWGLNKRPIIPYTFSFGGYFLEKNVSPLLSQRCHSKFLLLFNPVAIATVWAVVSRWVGGDVSPSSFSLQICSNCFGPSLKNISNGFQRIACV